MTTYLFESDGGHQVELDFPMGKAPKIGDSIVRGGVQLTRVASFTLADAKLRREVDGYPYASNSLPKGACPSIVKHDKRGRPIIPSERVEREVLKRTKYVRP